MPAIPDRNLRLSKLSLKISSKILMNDDEPFEVVKNGFVYTRQTDEETGLQQVVRYKIEISKSG